MQASLLSHYLLDITAINTVNQFGTILALQLFPSKTLGCSLLQNSLTVTY